jgi:hypothetical protein
MAQVSDKNVSLKDQNFKQQTPNTYRWALGASGVVAAATTATFSIKPDVAGYALAGLVLFILLMLVVVVLETGTTNNGTTLQVKVLSWFAVVAFISGAGAIMSSIAFKYPVDLSQDTTSPKFLASIQRFELSDSKIERTGEKSWHQGFQDKRDPYSFLEVGFNSEFLSLWDHHRQVNVRVPARGGMVQWSLDDLRIKDCTKGYCWADVGQATPYCKSLFNGSRC